jgi:AraC-like DNA-binding protein
LASEVDRSFVPAVYAARFIELLRARGVDIEAVLRGTGVTHAVVDDPNGHVSLASMALLLWSGVRIADDPSLGLELGLELQPTTHGPLGVALISCDSLGDAIRLGERYIVQRSVGWGIRLVVEGEWAILRFDERIHLGPVRMFALELVLGGIVRLGELTLGVSFADSEVEFHADYPEQPHHARFRHRLPRILYDQPALHARFPASWLQRPLSWRDPVVKRAAVVALEDERRVLGSDVTDFVARTRALLAETGRAPPDLDRAAELLAVSARTLRRHLSREGVTFQELREEARRARALDLLAASALSLDDIASELGYGGAASFTRAFVRWTGETPGEHRRRSRR